MNDSTSQPRLPVAGPSITEKEIGYVTDAVTRAWYGDANIYHARFESSFAEYVDRKFAVTLPSCTSGLHLALAALGIGEGDEVIVPDLTWIATAAPISYVGATPVFADVDPRSWCVTAETLESVVTPRTKAVIVVDLYGNVPDMDAILARFAGLGIPLIEDAAEAVGSTYKGRRAGGFGLASVFSFHGSKTLTTGEGGMLVTDDETFFRRVQFLRDHGRPSGDRTFRSSEVAFKYKMSSMQAALGLAQLERMDELVRRKREIFDWYHDAFADVADVTLNEEAQHVESTYWMVTAVMTGSPALDKFAVMKLLSESGIDTRPIFDPLSAIPAYEGHPEAQRARERNAVSYALAPSGINLPSGFNLGSNDASRVATEMRKILARSNP